MSKADWKKMYMTLVGGIENALETLPMNDENEIGRSCLIQAMLAAEEVYLDTAEPGVAHETEKTKKAAVI